MDPQKASLGVVELIVISQKIFNRLLGTGELLVADGMKPDLAEICCRKMHRPYVLSWVWHMGVAGCYSSCWAKSGFQTTRQRSSCKPRNLTLDNITVSIRYRIGTIQTWGLSYWSSASTDRTFVLFHYLFLLSCLALYLSCILYSQSVSLHAQFLAPVWRCCDTLS